MKVSHANARADGPVALVQSLIETLQQEHTALETLATEFGRQLDALRKQLQQEHEQAMHAANEAVNTLARLRAKRERQMRVLGRILRVEAEAASLQQLAIAMQGRPDLATLGTQLLDIRTAVRERAQQTQHVCEQLDYALQYAVRLGREMLQVMSHLDVPPPPCVYTASGGTARATSQRSLLNRVG